MLLLLGGGVVANVILPKNKGFDSGWVVITFGWGLAVFSGVYVAFRSGAHLNPAVTIGLLADGAKNYATGVPVSFSSTMVYLAGEMVGAFLGAVLVYIAYYVVDYNIQSPRPSRPRATCCWTPWAARCWP